MIAKLLSPRRVCCTAAALFAVAAAPSASAHHDVLFPDGGELVQPGELVTIEWTVTIEHVLIDWDVFYSVNGDMGSWIPIRFGIAPGDPTVGSLHSVDWIVPDIPTTNARILVRMNTAQMSYEFASDGDFTIVAALGDRTCAGQSANSSGSAAQLYLVGDPTTAVNGLTLNVASLPSNALGYPINSDTLGFASMPGGSQGNLCLGGTIGRHIDQVTSSGAAGFVSIPIDLTEIPRAGATVAALAGETWRFQYWTRDANPQSTSNFSDVVSVMLL